MDNIVVMRGRALSESECAAIRAVIELQEHQDFKKSFEGWDKAQDIDDARRMWRPNDTCKLKAITAAMANQSK
ncbi:hypothetical protein OC842_007251 [Tilletia horrida]|uniref:Uncharacterized protein n=1 Tax=Tilletia horrida TaxID=155126 RepID=A0AAN6JGY1_9BASI|nr:hypothetical protein OC842_007251 [Tilletia horrida]